MRLTVALFENPVPVPGLAIEKHLIAKPEGFEAEVQDGILWLANGTGVPLAKVRYVVRETPRVNVPGDDPPASPPRARGGKAKGGPQK